MDQLNQRDLEFLLAQTTKRLRYEEKRISKPKEGGVDMQKLKVGHIKRLVRKLRNMQSLSPQDTDAAYAVMEEYGDSD